MAAQDGGTTKGAGSRSEFKNDKFKIIYVQRYFHRAVIGFMR